MHPDYLADRIPIIPLAVFLDEKILAVHIEGQAAEDVDWTVTAVGPGDKPGTIRIGYTDAAGSKGSRELRNSSDWLSVPRTAHNASKTADVYEVTAA